MLRGIRNLKSNTEHLRKTFDAMLEAETRRFETTRNKRFLWIILAFQLATLGLMLFIFFGDWGRFLWRLNVLPTSYFYFEPPVDGAPFLRGLAFYIMPVVYVLLVLALLLFIVMTLRHLLKKDEVIVAVYKERSFGQAANTAGEASLGTPEGYRFEEPLNPFALFYLIAALLVVILGFFAPDDTLDMPFMFDLRNRIISDVVGLIILSILVITTLILMNFTYDRKALPKIDDVRREIMERKKESEENKSLV